MRATIYAIGLVILLTSFSHASGFRLGPEFQVNTLAKGDQFKPSVAGLGKNGFVVIWRSDERFGGTSRSLIRGQRYDAEGARSGKEFVVGRTEDGTGTVAGLSDGGFVVVWQTFDGLFYSVKGQLFNAAGRRVGTIFDVNKTDMTEFSRVSVSSLANGDFIIVWTGNRVFSTRQLVFSRRYSPNGVPVTDELKVNAKPAVGRVSDGAVRRLPDGGFVVGWNDAGEVKLRRYNKAGSPVGSEFAIATPRFLGRISLTSLSNGGFVAIYEAYRNSFRATDIFGQRYNAAGLPVDSEFKISTTTTGSQSSPAVARIKKGFVVTWASRQTLSTIEVFAQRFTDEGIRIGREFREFRVNTYTRSWQVSPSAAGLGDAGFVITWESGFSFQTGQDGDGVGIFGQRFSR